jgi:hypothetical protein
MPRRNRVTPFGEIVATTDRGTMFGNRGILHDDSRTIVRAWQVRRWLVCRLDYKGIRREIMRPHSYTELFFLDEATALAAGHRPCAECRRDAYRRFQDQWARAIGGATDADTMDDALHAARLDHRKKRTYVDDLRRLPNGAFVVLEGAAWLVLGSRLWAWSGSGYERSMARPVRLDVEVLTPRPTVAVLAAGYAAGLHLSALGDP